MIHRLGALSVHAAEDESPGEVRATRVALYAVEVMQRQVDVADHRRPIFRKRPRTVPRRRSDVPSNFSAQHATEQVWQQLQTLAGSVAEMLRSHR